MEKNLILNGSKLFFRVLMLCAIVLSIFHIGAFYGIWKEEGQSPLEFFTTERTYEYNSFSQLEIPDYVSMQIKDYNFIVNLIWAALGCAFMIMLIDYWIDKENHFITRIIKFFERGWNDLENESKDR